MAATPQRIIPYLCYRDAPGAIDFLCGAFGFRERSRHPMPDGRLGHAEVAHGEASVFLASVWDDMGFASPQDLPGRHAQIYMYVDDVDAHCQAARRAGATIAEEPADQPHGDRTYRALDPEGHRWIFAQRGAA